jgi:hypothetical protein
MQSESSPLSLSPGLCHVTAIYLLFLFLFFECQEIQALVYNPSNQLRPINNMLKLVLCLSLLATPLLAQPGDFNSLTKRHDTLSLNIYMKYAEFSSDEDFKAINCTTAYPMGTKPVTLSSQSPGNTFGDGLDTSTWTNTFHAHLLASVPLRADEGTRSFHIEGLGKGKDLNVSHGCIIPNHL